MKLGRARGDDDTVKILLMDVGDHLLLSGVGAGEHLGLGKHHARLVLDRLTDLLHFDVVGDIPATVANENTDPSLFHRSALFLST